MNIRYYFIFLTSFLSKFKKLLIASILIGAGAFFIYPLVAKVMGVFDSGETIGLVGRVALDNLPGTIQRQLSVGLTTIDEDGTARPGIASEWTTEEAGKQWIFKLNDKKWQDGEKIVSRDINYNFSDVKTEILDEKTIKMILQDPFAPLPTVVSKPLFKKGLLGAGDWKASKLSSLSAQITKSLQLVNIKTGEKKTYKFYPTEEAVRVAFKLGEVEKVVDLTDPKDLLNWRGTGTESKVQEDSYVGIFLNTQDPTLSSKNIRQGLTYAIDKESFGQKRALGPISPKSWAFNPQVKQYDYDKGRAATLLAQDTKEGEKLKINLVTTPSLLGIAEKIKIYWEDAGAETHIQVANSPPGEFQALLAIQTIPPDPDQYSLWHSTQEETNITHYKNPQKESPRIDKLLEEGRKTLDQEERKKIYIDFQRFLLEDIPAIPLFHPTLYTITRH